MGWVVADRDVLAGDLHDHPSQVADADALLAPNVKRAEELVVVQFLHAAEHGVQNIVNEAVGTGLLSCAQDDEELALGIFNGPADEDGDGRAGGQIQVLVGAVDADEPDDGRPQGCALLCQGAEVPRHFLSLGAGVHGCRGEITLAPMLPSSSAPLLFLFKAAGVQRGHVGAADEGGVAFFGEGLEVAVVGVAVVLDAAALDGGFDLQDAVGDGAAGGEAQVFADTSATLSTSLGEGDAVVAVVYVLPLVDDLHIGDEFFDDVAQLGDLVVLVVGADVEDLALFLSQGAEVQGSKGAEVLTSTDLR